MKKNFLLLLTLLLGSLSAMAQGRIFSIVEGNPDPKAFAMGNTLGMRADRFHIFTNPGSMVLDENRLSVDVSTEIFPKPEFDKGRMMQYNVAAGYKFLPQHAVMAGFRYAGGIQIPRMLDASGTGSETTIAPFDWVADLGYSFAIQPSWSVYLTGAYATSYIGKTASALLFSVGTSYMGDLMIANSGATYSLSARISNIGGSVKYSDSEATYPSPMAVELGGDMVFPIASEHVVTWALGARYFTPKDATQLRMGTGVDYTYKDMVSVRAGYDHISNIGHNLRFGLGGKYMGVRLDVSYGVGLSNSYTANTLLVGLGYTLK